MPKTGNFLTKFFLSDKIVRYRKDFLHLNKDFLRFCVLTLLPGGNVKTQKTGNFLGKREISREKGQFRKIEKILTKKTRPFSRIKRPFSRLNIPPWS